MKLGRSWQRLRKAIARRFAGGRRVTFEVMPERAYTLGGRCYSPAGAEKKAAVAIVTFFDAAGEPIPGPYQGLSHSERTGCYRYLPAGQPDAPAAFTLKVVAPEGARRVEIVIRPWRSHPILLPEDPHWRELGLAGITGSQLLLADWQALVATCRDDQERPLVVISSGTKPIGENHRSNRSMQFALELADLGCATVYVYYRRTPLATMPAKIRPNLIQMPNDIFHGMASEIAASNLKNPRIFLCSIADFHAVHEINLFKHFGWSVIYEVRDDWEEFHIAGLARWYHHLFERYLCRTADSVVAVSPPLCRKMITLGAPPGAVRLIPNATPQAFIDKARRQRERRRAQWALPGRPLVGFFGHLNAAWFDWALVLATARARPELSFQIIGVDPPKTLDLPANVELLGPKSHDDLIELTEHWTLGMIPRKLGKLSRAMDPIKIYDYLALGLRSVSPLMGQLDRYPLTFLYHSEHHFGSTLDEALRYVPSAEDWRRVDRLLQQATWSKRIREVLDLALEPRPERAVPATLGAP